MSNTPNNQEAADLEGMALRYLGGELSPQELIALRDQLTSDPVSAKRFIGYIQLVSMVREQARRVEGIRKELSYPSDLDVNFNEVLAALRPPDDVMPVDLHKRSALQDQSRQQANDMVAFRQACKALNYFALKGLRNKAGVIGSIAAVLVLGVLLYLTILSFSSATPESPGMTGNIPATPGTQVKRIVATLTAEHHAQWQAASGAILPEVGDDLSSGQQMILIDGFAEITTRRGAKALLQAPCTVEFTDSDNAIRLHQGKLFGVCLTERSRGFTVYTEHARIVDLGTRFGVEADAEGNSSALVQEGEIVVKSTAGDSESVPPLPRALTAGQAVAIEGNGSTISNINYQPLVFVSDTEFEAMVRADAEPYQRWLAHSYELRRRKDVIAYYTFEQDQARPELLVNQSAFSEVDLDGRLEGNNGLPQWSEGRWKNKGALHFNRNGKHMVSVPFRVGMLLDREISIATWIRFDDLAASQHLLTQRIADKAEGAPLRIGLNLVWNGDEDNKPYLNHSLCFVTNRKIGDPAFDTRFFQAPSVKPDQWVHLAVTHDGQQSVYYVDGQRLAAYTDSEPFVSLDAPLMIGGLIDHAPLNQETFGGSIDELAIFRSALSEDEIVQIYEAGKRTAR